MGLAIPGGSMLIIPAPSYSLAHAAWIPRLTIRRDDVTMQRNISRSSRLRRSSGWPSELSAVKRVLEAEPTTSALTLRRLLGPVRLIPVAAQVGRSYYKAETALQVFDLIETPEGGSNWLC